MSRLINVCGVKLVTDPAPNLLPDMRTRIDLTMKNGMVTMPGEMVAEVVQSMVAVLIARGDDHWVEKIQDRIKVMQTMDLDE